MLAAPLVPQRPPGRASRKARAYAAEIRRLQGLGYTLQAIREALAEAGVVVSKSTVQREAARVPATPSPVSPTPIASLPAAVTRHAAPAAPPVLQPQCGRDVAAAFVSARVTNPLFRKAQR